MISILTPRYVNSDWCTREIREFCEVAGRTGGVVVGNKSRVIKIIKTPVDSEDISPGRDSAYLGIRVLRSRR